MMGVRVIFKIGKGEFKLGGFAFLGSVVNIINELCGFDPELH